MQTLRAPALTGTKVQSSRRVDSERITELAVAMEARLNAAIARISDLNGQTKIISVNAKMEAARAGGNAGAAFGVVAQSIQQVSAETARVAQHLATDSRSVCTELREVNTELATRVKGERLSDLALMNIDVIDRNLYERSCDCRWWATDRSVVDVLADPTPESAGYCSMRLGQILDSYTVYFDIVVSDLTGRVIANGRPEHFASAGSRQNSAGWFTSAMSKASGTEFGFESVHRSELVNGERVLAYSCTVREQGDVNGRVLGVLAVLFRWDALAQTIVRNTPLTDREKELTRVCIVDSHRRILADTAECFLEVLPLTGVGPLLLGARNYAVIDGEADGAVIGHARAPGFETYSTGWHSLIIQRSSAKAAMNLPAV